MNAVMLIKYTTRHLSVAQRQVSLFYSAPILNVSMPHWYFLA